MTTEPQDPEATEPTLEELIAKITHPKQLAFLENLPKFNAIVKDTADATGISDYTPYLWLKVNKDFALAYLAVKKKIDDERLQRYEAELDKRVLQNPSKMSDVLLMFGLKAFSPNKYRERPVIDAQIVGDIVFKMDLPPYIDEVEGIKFKPKQLKEGKPEPKVT